MRLTFLLPLNAPFSALRSDIIAQPETIYLLNEFYRKLNSLKEDRMRKINSALFKVRDRFFHEVGKKWKRDTLTTITMRYLYGYNNVSVIRNILEVR